MTTCLFHAIPLTPIHIGDGSQLAAEEFRIQGGILQRFSPTRVVADMPPAQQQQFVAAIGAGRLQEAQAQIRAAARDVHVLESVAVGPASERYLKDAINNPAQSGKASPFIRTGGRPFIPGSTLKGALRTALVNELAHDTHHQQRVRANIEPRVRALTNAQAKTGPISDELQQLALDTPPHSTERDPLRYLSVGDGILPEHATRFDAVTVGWSQRKDGEDGRQLHVERLWSWGDGSTGVAAFPLAISVTEPERQEKARGLDGGRTPASILGLEAVLGAADAFYRRRWESELSRFFGRYSWSLEALRADLETELRALSGQPPVLLRVGRFGHFESKSVDEWRRGWQAQPRPGRYVKEGSSRAVLRGLTQFPLPFGWLLLVPATPEVRAWVQQRVPEKPGSLSVRIAPPSDLPARQRGGPAAPPAPVRRGGPPSLVGRTGTVDGERVRIIEDNGDKLWVEFTETGEREEIKRSEFK
jgi:CRISPR-associated protein Csm5